MGWRTLILLYLDDLLLILRSCVLELALDSEDERECWGSEGTRLGGWSFAWYKGITGPLGMYAGWGRIGDSSNASFPKVFSVSTTRLTLGGPWNTGLMTRNVL